MILQGVYQLVESGRVKVLFENSGGMEVTIPVKDWMEMGSPQEVSVTVMKLLVRTGSKT